MKLELKNVKLNKALSDETDCFSATLYAEGKRVATVANRGCGGDNEYNVIDKIMFEAVKTYAYGLPDRVSKTIEGFRYSVDVDMLVEDLIYEKQIRDDFKKKNKGKTAYRKNGHDYMVGEYHRLNAPDTDPRVANYLMENDASILSVETIIEEMRDKSI